MPSLGLVLLLLLPTALSLNCLDCSWSDKGSLSKQATIAACRTQSQTCSTSDFCVKIIPNNNPNQTYTSQCWNQNTLGIQVISSGNCYNNTDQEEYCFCSNKDYCNEASRGFSLVSFALLLGFKFTL